MVWLCTSWLLLWNFTQDIFKTILYLYPIIMWSTSAGESSLLRDHIYHQRGGIIPREELKKVNKEIWFWWLMLCYLLLYPSGSISNRHSNWYECGPIFRISKYISEGTYDEVNKHTKWAMTLGSVIPQNVLSCYSLLLFLILSPLLSRH